jgi:cell division protein FtsB
MRSTGSQHSTKKKKVKVFRPAIFFMNMVLLFIFALILNTTYKYIRLEWVNRGVEKENNRLLQEISKIQEDIKLTKSPDFLEIMARQMDMVKDGEYVIILPVEK